MKIITIVSAFFLYTNCSGQINVNDASLQVDTNQIKNVCQCNDAIVLLMKEEITILTEVKRIGIEDPTVELLNDEYEKRIDKFMEVYTHCFPLFQQAGGDSNCSNKTEAEKLEKELNALKKDLIIDQN